MVEMKGENIGMGRKITTVLYFMICSVHLCFQINVQSGAPVPDANPTINLKFTINQMVVSGIKVNRLDMYGEVKNFTFHCDVTVVEIWKACHRHERAEI